MGDNYSSKSQLVTHDQNIVGYITFVNNELVCCSQGI